MARARNGFVILCLVLTGIVTPGWLVSPSFAQTESESPVPFRIAIIIDDIGYNPTTGERAIQLPGAITYAVIPFSPYAERLALRALALDKEVMLHLPMEGSLGNRLDTGGITREHSRYDVKKRTQAAFTAIPGARGFNNHMGSKLTTDRLALTWVMEEAPEHMDFFIDSMTSPHSIAANVAHQHGVPTLRRDVFLDPLPDARTIARQYERLLWVAQQKGYAIGIGHPFPATLALLEEQLPLLADHNIELVSASELVRDYHASVAPSLWDRRTMLRQLASLPSPQHARFKLLP